MQRAKKQDRAKAQSKATQLRAGRADEGGANYSSFRGKNGKIRGTKIKETKPGKSGNLGQNTP